MKAVTMMKAEQEVYIFIMSQAGYQKKEYQKKQKKILLGIN